MRALEIGAGTHLMPPFYDLSRPVRELLGAAVGRSGGSEAFLGDLLAARTTVRDCQNATLGGTVVPGDPNRRVDLAAPLTAREIEPLCGTCPRC